MRSAGTLLAATIWAASPAERSLRNSLLSMNSACVATVVVGKWCGELDVQRMKSVLNRETDDDADEPEKVIDAIDDHMPAKAA